MKIEGLPRPVFSPENPYFGPFRSTGQDFAYAWTWEVHMPHPAPHIGALIRMIRGGFVPQLLMQAFRGDVKNQWRKLQNAQAPQG